ncbi:MAG: superoxide dismutase family protein [Pseudomonadota bacterium]
MRLFALAAAVAAIALPAGAAQGTLTVPLKGPRGQDLGQATLTEGPRGVLIRIAARGLTPGWHGVHFHARGDCSSADFKSAGAHVHGGDKPTHGLLNPGGDEAGDLPNIWADAGGAANAELFSAFVTLGEAAGRGNLLDADGSALVVHAGPDDHAGQPIGGSGDRVACGAIKAP